MAFQLINELCCIKHCWGVYEQNSIVVRSVDLKQVCAAIPIYLRYETEKYMPHILHRQFNSTALIVLDNFYNHYWAFSIQMENSLWHRLCSPLTVKGKCTCCVKSTLNIISIFTAPPTKLWEGYVFTGVCLSFGSGEGDLTLQPPPWNKTCGPPAQPRPAPWTWDIGHWTHPPPTPSTQPPASDIWWSGLETCSNMFTWGHPPTSWHLVAIEVTGTVGGSSRYISYWNALLLHLVSTQ